MRDLIKVHERAKDVNEKDGARLSRLRKQLEVLESEVGVEKRGC